MYIFKRKTTYYIHYLDEITGNQRRKSTGKRTKAEALKYLSNFRHELKMSGQIEKIFLYDFIKEYEKYVLQTKSKKYLESVKLSFRKLKEFLPNKNIKEIKVKEIEKFLLKTHDRSISSAHLYYKTLKAAFNKAIFWGYLVENAFVKVKLPKKEKKIPIFITEKDLKNILLQTNNPVLQRIFVVAFYTGMRLSEITNLKWEAVDLENKRLKVQITDNFTTKNKKERMIPISDLIMEDIIINKKENNSEYVFSKACKYKYSNDYVTHKFKRAVRQAKLSDKIHFHTLRHSFASNLVQKGVSLCVVKELLGHEDISTTQIYSHLNRFSLESAVNQL
jgi:integrase/recombinase XerD